MFLLFSFRFMHRKIKTIVLHTFLILFKLFIQFYAQPAHLTQSSCLSETPKKSTQSSYAKLVKGFDDF